MKPLSAWCCRPRCAASGCRFRLPRCVVRSSCRCGHCGLGEFRHPQQVASTARKVSSALQAGLKEVRCAVNHVVIVEKGEHSFGAYVPDLPGWRHRAGRSRRGCTRCGPDPGAVPRSTVSGLSTAIAVRCAVRATNAGHRKCCSITITRKGASPCRLSQQALE